MAWALPSGATSTDDTVPIAWPCLFLICAVANARAGLSIASRLTPDFSSLSVTGRSGPTALSISFPVLAAARSVALGLGLAVGAASARSAIMAKSGRALAATRPKARNNFFVLVILDSLFRLSMFWPCGDQFGPRLSFFLSPAAF